ncbi:arginine/serine-rich coiled-coil protein 2 isoform X2 [Sesamum indicum]|uniref:Arginine/serine-rich coiled-coil protein 2 isoform X2 n=1 Tax=Sesamum indicum TaxID=4182 RepID=A0A8M8UYH2_SESIN|nr:arginine/serine-rich coiled-coil protein 2 isoform X2 [Sesamum indicum]
MYSGSPRRERSSSPVPSKKDISKLADDTRKKDDSRSQSGRSGESYKHSDRQSSRSYHRHDDRSRRDRHVDDYDRGYSKPSYRSGRDSRDYNNLDHSKGDKEHRSRDYVNDVDTYSHSKLDGSGHRNRDKDSYDRAGSGRRHANMEERDRDRDRERHREDKGDRYGKTDYRKGSVDHKTDRSPAYEESRGQQNDSSSRRDSSGHRLREASQRDAKELDAERSATDEKRRHENRGVYKDQHNSEPKEHSDDVSTKGQDSVAKKPKISSLESTGPGTEGNSDQAFVKDSDIDAAKIAAMKAAELVNRNLVGTGYMSTDQKKKLLWGNKKNTAVEESAHRWDTTMFGDRERQEKFNKLMSLRLHWYLWPIVGREGRCKDGAEARQSRCGEAAGAASDGAGEAIHSWIASERWSNCWARSLRFSFSYPRACIRGSSGIMLYCMKKLFCKMLNDHHVRISQSLVMICKVTRYSMFSKLFTLNVFRGLGLSSRSLCAYFCQSFVKCCFFLPFGWIGYFVSLGPSFFHTGIAHCSATHLVE